MSEFRDTDGRTWKFRITVADILPLKEAGLDLDQIAKSLSLDHLFSLTPSELFGICWYLVSKGQPALKIEELAEAMDGETAERASEALIAAVVDFFPWVRSKVNPRIGQAMQEIRGILSASGEPAGKPEE